MLGTLIPNALRRHGYALLKYWTYGLLLGNVFLFLREENLSLVHTFGAGLRLEDFIQAYSATIDTAAWLILLLLFELETSVLPRASVTGTVKHALHGVRAVCFLFILYAFYGYLGELATLYQLSPLPPDAACALAVEGDWALLLGLDRYAPLSANNCTVAVWQVGEFSVAAGPAGLGAARWLAWTDVINAGAWIVVVLVLEIDVRLRLRSGYGASGWFPAAAGKALKAVLYSILLGALASWGIKGNVLDVWDAALWLFAFAFIEMNVFGWEVAGRKARGG